MPIFKVVDIETYEHIYIVEAKDTGEAYDIAYNSDPDTWLYDGVEYQGNVNEDIIEVFKYESTGEYLEKPPKDTQHAPYWGY